MKTEGEQFRDQLQYGQAPDIAIKFTRKPGTTRFPDDHAYRVSGWYKMVDPEALKREEEKLYKNGRSWINDILIDSAHKRDGKLIMKCTREEATHVSGTGVAGCIVPVSEIICDGYVNWDKETIDRERESALRGLGEYIS